MTAYVFRRPTTIDLASNLYFYPLGLSVYLLVGLSIQEERNAIIAHPTVCSVGLIILANTVPESELTIICKLHEMINSQMTASSFPRSPPPASSSSPSPRFSAPPLDHQTCRARFVSLRHSGPPSDCCAIGDWAAQGVPAGFPKSE